MLRNIEKTYSAPARHWVGDGFHVSPLFNHMQGDKYTSPFLMLDYAMPQHFAPNEAQSPKGVGAHPHAGFETVTLALQGEVAHRDSAGNGGTIATGDVQWMTAGNGIVHEEFHSEAFSKTGGMFEMVQLWVNLPAAKKKRRPCLPRAESGRHSGHQTRRRQRPPHRRQPFRQQRRGQHPHRAQHVGNRPAN